MDDGKNRSLGRDAVVASGRIGAAQSGDRDAVETLLKEYEGLVRDCARGWRLPGADEEDFRQYARLGLWEAIRSFDPTRGVPFVQYARKVMLNAIRDAARAAGREKHRILNEAAPLEGSGAEMIPAAEPEPWEGERERDLFARVRRLLCERQYRVVVLHCLGLTPLQTAQELDLTPKQVYNAWQRAITTLRAHRDELFDESRVPMRREEVTTR